MILCSFKQLFTSVPQHIGFYKVNTFRLGDVFTIDVEVVIAFIILKVNKFLEVYYEK